MNILRNIEKPVIASGSISDRVAITYLWIATPSASLRVRNDGGVLE